MSTFGRPSRQRPHVRFATQRLTNWPNNTLTLTRHLLLFGFLVGCGLVDNSAADTVKVATVQFGPVLGDVTGNRERLVSLSEQAAKNGAKIVVHTEMATSGYSFFSRQEISGSAETVPGKTTAALGAIAKQYQIYIAVGLPEYEPDTKLYYNSAVLVDPDGNVAGVYRKRNNLLEASYNAEDYGAIPVFETPYGKLGIVICADLFYAEFPREAAVAGADILLAPANVGVTAEFLQVRTYENDIAVIVANRYGKGLSGKKANYFNQQTFSIPSPFPYDFEGAASYILTSSGVVLTTVSGAEDQIGYGELTVGTERKFPVVRRPELYSLIAQDTLEPYTFKQLGLPAATTFAAAAVDPGDSDTPWAAAATAVTQAIAAAKQQNLSLKLLVLPGNYFATADPTGIATLQTIATTNDLDIFLNLGATVPPLSLLLTPEGETYTYKRTHRLLNSTIPADALSPYYWVVDRSYARVALMQDIDMLPPETSMVMAKLGVDVIAVNANSSLPILSALWQSRTGSNAHIIVANGLAKEGIYRGGYVNTPPFVEADKLVILTLDTSAVRTKAVPRFMDPRQLLEACNGSNC